jgi:hypothetical protein
MAAQVAGHLMAAQEAAHLVAAHLMVAHLADQTFQHRAEHKDYYNCPHVHPDGGWKLFPSFAAPDQHVLTEIHCLAVHSSLSCFEAGQMCLPVQQHQQPYMMLAPDGI